MSWNRIAAYYAAGAALWLVYLLVVYRAESQRVPEPVGRSPALVDLPPGRVEALEVRRSGRRVRCERRDGRWRVVDPAQGRVASGLIEALIDNLTGAADMDVVGDATTARTLFGLDSPRGAIVLEARQERIVLLIGERNPTQTAVYMMREGDSRIFLGGLNVDYYQELLFTTVYPAAGSR